MTIRLTDVHVDKLSHRELPARFVAVVTTAVLLAGGSANAADQGLTGKKLLLTSAPKLLVLSKDPSISIAGSDPIAGADSSVSFDDGDVPVTFSLPSANWSTNGSGTVFKYKNVDAPGGPSLVKVAQVKPGLLKVVAKGVPFDVPNGAASIDVVLSLDGDSNKYCMTFAGTGDGSKFMVKDALAGVCGPVARRAFQTSTEYTGDLVGAANNLAGDNVALYNCSSDLYTGGTYVDDAGASGVNAADCLCRERAASQGSDLACSGGGFGCWKAWIADSTAGSAPASRFDMAVSASTDPILEVDTSGAADPSAPIAVGGWPDLTVCGDEAPDPENGNLTVCLDDPAITTNVPVTDWRNESGLRIGFSGGSWTNVLKDGTRTTSDSHCQNWSSADPFGPGQVGSVVHRSEAWTNVDLAGCDLGEGLYCIED
jgi:hypothetical protein